MFARLRQSERAFWFLGARHVREARGRAAESVTAPERPFRRQYLTDSNAVRSHFRAIAKPAIEMLRIRVTPQARFRSWEAARVPTPLSRRFRVRTCARRWESAERVELDILAAWGPLVGLTLWVEWSACCWC